MPEMSSDAAETTATRIDFEIKPALKEMRTEVNSSVSASLIENNGQSDKISLNQSGMLNFLPLTDNLSSEVHSNNMVSTEASEASMPQTSTLGHCSVSEDDMPTEIPLAATIFFEWSENLKACKTEGELNDYFQNQMTSSLPGAEVTRKRKRPRFHTLEELRDVVVPQLEALLRYHEAKKLK